MKPADALGELRIGDLKTFLAVRRTGSITAAARELGVTPSQVSKAVTRLEGILKLRLLSRSSRGVSLSEAGHRVIPHLEDAVARLSQLGQAEDERAPELTVAAPSYLITTFLPTIAACQEHTRVRGIELPPSLVRAYASESFFDLTLLPRSVERMPKAWASVMVGDIRSGLFGTPELARSLGPQPVPVDKLLSVPFVTPIYNADGRFVATDDDCPLSLSERRLGHAAQTIGLALELAARAGQLVFGPVLAARRLTASGALVEIPVRGWSVKEPLYLSCNGDRVLARVQTAVVKALHRMIAELDQA